MKIKLKRLSITTSSLLVAVMVVLSCNDKFQERAPQGVYSSSSLASAGGVEGSLVNAYASLRYCCDWYSTPNNWLWGSILGADAYKGSEQTDQNALNPIVIYKPNPGDGPVGSKWRISYDGVGQANAVLRALVTAKDIPDADRTRIASEARFIRGLYHFELKKVFNNVPYVDENVTDFRISNDQDIWPQIEADFKFAYDNLGPTASSVGRANKWAAGAYLAKAYMFRKKFTDALPLLQQIYSQGTTASGVKYGLMEKYHDNFRIATKNNKETVFAIQYTVRDGANGNNGNYENVLNYPFGGGPGGCCGFFQPSQTFVNSFKTGSDGLPLFDTFNASDVTSDEAFASANRTFVPYQGTLDPRLDWSVGRREIPYLDWGFHPGVAWIRKVDYGGPFSPIKNVYYKAEESSGAENGSWGQKFNANNYNLIRFADVILWLAEAEAEAGSPARARDLVNEIRRRAANPDGFVKGRFSGYNASGEKIMDLTQPAANYVINEYTNAWDKTFALKAIRFERKLELGMEGHRFFDLVRWGTASDELTAYIAKESVKRSVMAGGAFVVGKSEYMPIPDFAIIQSNKDGKPTLAQNPGY
ncbi:MAG: RagB/SusD family nutrient uptake outer membrane protein [Chryseotalea sp. WA131a]|jgi:hypothetical protein|nr:MAG: RagB/SusD family nutrient uptake outer membrane protein [Chryseotalea sp. WA131a]